MPSAQPIPVQPAPTHPLPAAPMPAEPVHTPPIPTPPVSVPPTPAPPIPTLPTHAPPVPALTAPPEKQETSQAVSGQFTSTSEDDVKQFEEAISNINIDMVHSETPSSGTSAGEKTSESEYYKPDELGEGYFSEIEHYMKNKDINKVIDDVLEKDFLTSMKDYHDKKGEGKPFYLHKKDLEHKLKKKMNQLRKLEEEWHRLKTQIQENEKKKKQTESQIDHEGQELKDIFRQIKISQLLEKETSKEHYFKLGTGEELKSLNDLRKALGYMSDYEFSHHVYPEKNDFAIWIKEALQAPEMYEKVKNIKTKQEFQEILENPL